MKIYKHEPLYLIQLTFRRGDEHVIHLTLCETTINETKKMLIELFPSVTQQSADHYKTRIEIRERVGGKNGAYTAVSFYGESAADTRNKLIKHLNSKQHHAN